MWSSLRRVAPGDVICLAPSFHGTKDQMGLPICPRCGCLFFLSCRLPLYLSQWGCPFAPGVAALCARACSPQLPCTGPCWRPAKYASGSPLPTRGSLALMPRIIFTVTGRNSGNRMLMRHPPSREAWKQPRRCPSPLTWQAQVIVPTRPPLTPTARLLARVTGIQKTSAWRSAMGAASGARIRSRHSTECQLRPDLAARGRAGAM